MRIPPGPPGHPPEREKIRGHLIAFVFGSGVGDIQSVNLR